MCKGENKTYVFDLLILKIFLVVLKIAL